MDQDQLVAEQRMCEITIPILLRGQDSIYSCVPGTPFRGGHYCRGRAAMALLGLWRRSLRALRPSEDWTGLANIRVGAGRKLGAAVSSWQGGWSTG